MSKILLDSKGRKNFYFYFLYILSNLYNNYKENKLQ